MTPFIAKGDSWQAAMSSGDGAFNLLKAQVLWQRLTGTPIL